MPDRFPRGALKAATDALRGDEAVARALLAAIQPSIERYPGHRDELDEYLAGQLQDPAFARSYARPCRSSLLVAPCALSPNTSSPWHAANS